MRLRSATVKHVAIAALVAAGVTTAAAESTNPIVNAAVGSPALCVYRGPAPYGARNNPAFAAWMGVPSVWGEDFMPTTDWDNIEGGGWQVRPWSEWKQAVTGRRFVLSVPLLTGPWNLSGPKLGMDAGKAVSLEAGAQGDYNRHFKILAERLVKAGLGDAILRLGWEMNGGWYAWRAKGHEAAFAGYWREIVATMRAVPGAAFRFNFNPTCGLEQFAADLAWPGDEAVDEVGLDVYDQSWQPGTYPIPSNAPPAEVLDRQGKAWDHLVHGDRGLLFWRDFARAHGKPFSIPEWGVWKRPDGHGGGDDPRFIENMHAFIMASTNRVAWHCYFDVGTSASRGEAHHQLSPGPDGTQVSSFPKAAAAFQRLFGAAQSLQVPRADAAITNGQRVFTCGHSFHAGFVPAWLKQIAEMAGIKGHTIAGVSYIGGSRVIQHWDVPDEKNEARKALSGGKVDVLTLSPMHQPDEGIDLFSKLALDHNPDIRITIQEFWCPYDRSRWPSKSEIEASDFDAATVASLLSGVKDGPPAAETRP